MIDRPSRDRLALLLRHLAVGRIATGLFGNECEDLCLGSEDPAILSVASGGPDIIRIPRRYWSRRRRGRNRLSDDMRHKIAMAILFLRSDYEYEWPQDDTRGLRGDCLLLVICLLLLVLGMFATIFWQLGQVSPLAAAGCFGLAVYVFYFSNMRVEKAERALVDKCRQLGDLEAWPFYRRSDFEEARKRPRLLSG
jgi:hypothetical protein